jgi:hypothetical protein
MKLHANARICLKNRHLLVDRLEEGWSLRSAAEAGGVNERIAARWLGRRRDDVPHRHFRSQGFFSQWEEPASQAGSRECARLDSNQ